MSETPSTNCSVIQHHTSESEQSLSARPFNVTEPVVAKRVCFYKSGDPQFNGVKMVVNNRSFKSFDALLDNLSKRVPLPFGVRNITTPRGIHSINNLEDLEDGKSYICSQQRKIKPINLEKASKKPLPWQNSRPISARRRAVQLTREGDRSAFQSTVKLSTPKKLLVFKNGNVRIRHTVVLGKKNTQNFEAFLEHISELMQYPVVKLYTTDGRKFLSLDRSPTFKLWFYVLELLSQQGENLSKQGIMIPIGTHYLVNWLGPPIVYTPEPRPSQRAEKGYSNNSESSYIPDSDMALLGNHSQTGEDFSVVPPADDIEKSVHLNQDGSMTVEMKVRFNIKEEETIKWTTCVSCAGNSSVVTEDQSSEINILTYKKPEEDFSQVEDDVSMQQIITEVINQDSAGKMESSTYDIWQNPSMNTDLSQSDDNPCKPHFYRPPTPGPRRVRQKKALVESVTVVSDKAVQKKLVGQFSYSEEMDSGETKSEYCVITHASSQTSSVANSNLSDVCSDHVMKQSQDNHTEEEMLNKSTRRSSGQHDEDASLQNVLEKSVLEEGLYNKKTSECDSSIGHAHSSLKTYHEPGQSLPSQSDATESNPGFFNNHSEWPPSKSEEIICNECKELHSSQASLHPSPPESNESVCKCAQITPTVAQPSSVTVKNDSAEGMTATQLSDESQAVFSTGKKKKKKRKKRKPTHNTEQDIGPHQNMNEVSMEGSAVSDVKTTEMRTPKDNTQYSSSQITTHKIMLAFPVGNSDSSNEKLTTKDDLYSQASLQSQPNELLSKLKKNPNRQLPKLKTKSDKKHNFLQSTKAEEGLLLVKKHSNNDIEHSKEILHDIITDQNSQNVETENAKISSNQGHKLSMKHKKAKKNKTIESAQGSEVEVLDDRSLGAFKHTDFTGEMTEHSLENYVQSWLQDIYPDAVRPDQHLAAIGTNDRKNQQLHVKSFLDKESELVRQTVCLSDENNITEGKQSRNLNEIEAVEDSVKELKNAYEKHIGCLTDADASLIEEAKYLLQSDIQNNTNLSLCNIQENDKKRVLTEGDGQSHMSEVAAQIHPQTINNIPGTDVEKDCMSSALLHELKLAILNAEKNYIGCIKKPCHLTDISLPSLLGSSSNLLLAWLLLLHLKESLSNANKDDILQTTCRCSEIFTLLKYLKQVAVNEKADDAITNIQDCAADCLIFSGKQIEKQEPMHCQENVSPVQNKNMPDIEEQDNLNKILMSSEAVDANELSEQLERIGEEQTKGRLSAENSNLNNLEVHDDCGHAQSDNSGLISNEDSLKENEDSSWQESQEKHTDTSYNNEESEISEEPKSTSHSITSHEKDHFFEIETSELDEKELKSTGEQESTEFFCKKENGNETLPSAAENATSGDTLDDSIHKELEEDGIFEETSEQLSVQSPLSFCYESKQIPVDGCEEELTSRVKLIVKELECGGSHSNSSLEFKKCLKSPVTSDLSDYRPETDESDSNFRHSSDLTNGSADEAVYEKEYNRGYVKRTIERLYGTAEASLKPISKPGPPYLAQMLEKDAGEPFHTVMENAPSLCQAHNAWSNDNMSSSLVSHEIPKDLNTADSAWEKENANLPAPQFSLNGEEAYYNDYAMQYINQNSQSSAPIPEDEGVLIEKGKWLLKENHLIRRSPPENNGMYGTTDTSADTVFDNHSDDIPYSHFGNLDTRPPLKEISSSELEDMAKPYGNGCNYFNMPHNSDSEPFSDALSIKSKNSQNGSTLPLEATRKVCTTSTQICTEVNTNTPAFTSVEFRLPDNKVHPIEQPLNDEPIQTQPNSNVNSIRNSHEDQDSLDKLHAICGQHCPILVAIIKPTNEAIRGCAYQKASDVENQVGLHFFLRSPLVMWQGEHVIGLDKNQVQLKNNGINKIVHNIFDRFYADNTLDFMNDNFRLLLSLKENQGSKKISIIGNMDINLQEINNHENYATEEALSEITGEQNNNLSVFQSSRGNINQIAGETPTPSFPDIIEDCESETFYHQGIFLNNIDWKVTVNLEDENALSTKENTLSSVKEEETRKWKIDTEDIGDLYKIRIGHNNSGETPDWYCKEVRYLNVNQLFFLKKVMYRLDVPLKDETCPHCLFYGYNAGIEIAMTEENLQLQNLVTEEQFDFYVDRWLTQNQDDGEICQECPVLQQGQPLLPGYLSLSSVVVYELHVVTGDLWNAGTEADVYIAIYGKKGDTGSRQLLRSKNPRKYLKGQVSELKWLDEGQDDGKIVRELYVIDNYTLAMRQEMEVKKAEMWATEKWKFQKGNTLQFYNKVTHGFIRLSQDRTVDALGTKKDKHGNFWSVPSNLFPSPLNVLGIFDVTVKKENTWIFKCHPMRNHALAVAHGSVTGMDHGDSHCELQVHVQPDRSIILESVQSPGETVAFSLQGTVPDDTTGYAGLTREFIVHVKGVFHNSAIILLTTSYCQSLCLRPDGSCNGAGNQSEDSYWKISKISSGVCMFESAKIPRMFLRIRDGQCDGKGTVGREKPMGTSATPAQQKDVITESRQHKAGLENLPPHRQPSSPLSQEMTNVQKVEFPFPSDEKWKVSILTGNSGTQANVTLWIYGDKGLAGPITLGKDNREQLFLPRTENAFQVAKEI
ncbi:hypothetical protein JD844_016214 [Phrynosoma platyrhinos]|uniref:Oxygen-regulated protein 1 n=1 Tax=Phrynosoma platyrhinos TaxID=52577 RepID=A0ABQ7SK28_PHRPL|nr:hypothetical protein JD844_016214 [Phrynosoma platyrhinos]